MIRKTTNKPINSNKQTQEKPSPNYKKYIAISAIAQLYFIHHFIDK